MSKQKRRVRARRHRHVQVTRRVYRTGGLAVAATLLSGGVAHAGTFSVTNTNDSGTGSLRDAITQANLTPAADTISFASSVTGTIDLASALPSINEPLTISGPGASKLAVSGQTKYGLFSAYGSGTTEIDGLTLEDGSVSEYGGAVNDTGSGALTLVGDDFVSDQALGGGGAVAVEAALTVSGSTFTSDSATHSDGGAISGYDSEVTVSGSTFQSDSSGGPGGAISVYGGGAGLTLSGSTFQSDYSARDGGAIYGYGAPLAISDSTFYENSAKYGGGAVGGYGGSLTLTGSTLVGNAVIGAPSGGNPGSGGGLSLYYTTTTIQDSIVSGNSASTDPDMQIFYGDPTTAFSLFGSLSGSGITPDATDIVGKDPKLAPLALNGGQVPTLRPEAGSPVIDAGKAFSETTDERGVARPTDLSKITNATGGDGSDIGAVEVTAANLTPTVSSLSSYSAAVGSTITITGTGFEGTSSVSFGSVAASYTVVSDTEISVTVPAGSGTVPVTVTNAYASTSTSAAEDFAYPGSPLTVTTPADSGSGSLRDALTQIAQNGGAHQITFASGVTGAIELKSSLPAINSPVTIVGPGAGELSVDGQGKYGLFDLTSAGPSSISGLTITGSNLSGIRSPSGALTVDGDDVTNNSAANGGGISAGTVTVTGSTVSGNTASTNDGGIDGGTVTVDDSTISGNTAARANGGVYAGTLTVNDSTISGNTAKYGGGGDAYSLTMTGSTVTGNSATQEGGIEAVGATIIGSTITANQATAAGGRGGGVTALAGGLTLKDSVVSGNTAFTGPDIYSKGSASAVFSLIGSTSGSKITPDSSDIVGKNPMLGSLGANGGPTATLLPLPGSPLLDAGNAFGSTTDQRGVSRTVDLPGVANVAGGDGTDIGAVEAQLPAVSGLSPSSATSGTVVTITGSGFSGATQVLFGTTPATAVTVINDGQITAAAPAGSGPVDVRVVTPYGESSVVTADGFTYLAAPTATSTTSTSPTPTPTATSTPTPTPTTTTTTGTTTTTTTPTPTPRPATIRAVLDNQQIVLSTSAPGVCTTSPVTVSLASTVIKGSKAKKATFLKAAFFLDRGVKHTRRVKVHKKVRTVVTYTPNLLVHKASGSDRLRATKGLHTLKVVVSYRVRVTQGHHVKTVTVTKTITAKLRVC